LPEINHPLIFKFQNTNLKKQIIFNIQKSISKQKKFNTFGVLHLYHWNLLEILLIDIWNLFEIC